MDPLCCLTGWGSAGRITIAGLSLGDLAVQYGTPLYIYDAETIYAQVRTLRDLAGKRYSGKVEAAYAAKAYFSLGLAQRLNALGLRLDAAAAGADPGAARRI